jgi:F0F1-type ATP synthase assembly protein I
MPQDDSTESREQGYYFALAQVGLEMVAPLIIGLVIDHYADWGPWATIGGVVLGFVGGVAHIVMLTNKHDSQQRKQGKDGDKGGGDAT